MSQFTSMIVLAGTAALSREIFAGARETVDPLGPPPRFPSVENAIRQRRILNYCFWIAQFLKIRKSPNF